MQRMTCCSRAADAQEFGQSFVGTAGRDLSKLSMTRARDGSENAPEAQTRVVQAGASGTAASDPCSSGC